MLAVKQNYLMISDIRPMCVLVLNIIIKYLDESGRNRFCHVKENLATGLPIVMGLN